MALFETQAHKANDTLAAQAKSCQFGGLEVDITYSAYQNQLFVGHELSDSTDGLTLSMWYHAIANRETCRFWFDIKNLSADNADSICALIENLSATIKKRAFIESQSDEALLKVKKQGFMTLFWVNNPYWDGDSLVSDEERAASSCTEISGTTSTEMRFSFSK